MNELKILEHEKLSFTANGNEYFIEQSISFERYKMYQKLQVECGYDVSFYGMFESLQKLFELQNQGKLAEAAVLTHNLMTGMSNIDKRPIPVLTMCALFINRKDEDRKIISDDIVNAKLEDWRLEGIAMESFFSIAAATMIGFTKACSDFSRSSSLLTKLRKNRSNTLKPESTK